MTTTRREFCVTAAAVGSITLVPFAARTADDGPDVFKGAGGEVRIHPVSHASFIIEAPMGTIYVDTIGGAGAYVDKPAPDLILITHRHGDHFDADTLNALGNAPIITNADVHSMMDDALKNRTTIMGHDAGTDWNGATIEAIPAYNKDPETKFHPKARSDNGFVLTMADFRIYISGDTEDIPEMRALKDIDLAFVCMNLPFTMTADAAASAVVEFKPKFVYPYHYRGKDGGTQDPKAFASMVGDAAEVKLFDWYPDNPDL